MVKKNVMGFDNDIDPIVLSFAFESRRSFS